METVKDAQSGPRDPSMLAPPSPLSAPTRPLAAPEWNPAPVAAPDASTGSSPAAAEIALDQLVVSIPGARGAVLASIDGFPISKSQTMPTEPSHAAMLAAAMGLARQLVAMGAGSSLRQLVIDHDGGLMLVWPIGAQRVLAVLADAGVDQRQLRNFVQANVRVLAHRPSGGLSAQS